MLNFWKFPTNSQQILKSSFIDAVNFTSVKTWKKSDNSNCQISIYSHLWRPVYSLPCGENLYFRVVYTPSAESRWNFWNRRKAAKLSFLGARWCAHDVLPGTLVNFLPLKVVRGNSVQSGLNFPAKRLSLFFENFVDASTDMLLNKYYIIIYRFCIEEWIKTFKKKTSLVCYFIAFGVNNSKNEICINDWV